MLTCLLRHILLSPYMFMFMLMSGTLHRTGYDNKTLNLKLVFSHNIFNSFSYFISHSCKSLDRLVIIQPVFLVTSDTIVECMSYQYRVNGNGRQRFSKCITGLSHFARYAELCSTVTNLLKTIEKNNKTLIY